MKSVDIEVDEGKILGKTIGYPKCYYPEILVPIPRHLNRDIYGITDPDNLFCGYDTWHAYECSVLTDSGVPVTFILKIVYSSTSQYIVESKSLKLYLASFNMERLGATQELAIEEFTSRVKRDLQNALKTEVKLGIFDYTYPQQPLTGYEEYRCIDNQLDSYNIQISNYTETPTLLQESCASGEERYCTHLLKSNCKVTKQPDWGSVYLYIKGNNIPTIESFIKYIISLRDENHFHEEICEMIYKRLSDIFHPDELAVTCLYTRRGGIDICPCRASNQELLNQVLQTKEYNDTPTFRR